MNDTVTKILELVSEYAEHYAEDRRWGTFTADTTKARQALQDELTRLFTPLTDEQIEAVSERVAVDDYAHDLTRRVEKAHGIGEKNEPDPYWHLRNIPGLTVDKYGNIGVGPK